MSQCWSSKGNQVMSILQVLLKMPGGTYRQLPLCVTTTFVWYVPSKPSSALTCSYHIINYRYPQPRSRYFSCIFVAAFFLIVDILPIICFNYFYSVFLARTKTVDLYFSTLYLYFSTDYLLFLNFYFYFFFFFLVSYQEEDD